MNFGLILCDFTNSLLGNNLRLPKPSRVILAAQICMPAETQTGKPRIDLSRYQLTVDGQRVKLERQPMELLIFFAQRQGQLVSREEIVEKLWGKDVFVDVDRSINAAVRKIRSALKDDPSEPKFLETVVGKGYRLVGEVELVGASSPVVERLLGTEADVSLRRGLQYGLILAIVVAAMIGVGWAYWRWRSSMHSSTSGIHSIAVLPLANLSTDVSQDYFADGMTDELISDLAQISALRVISRTSVMKYRNASVSVPEIGKVLHVDAVVEGSVERSAGRVRVSAQLIQASTDTHLWAKSYERDLGDAIALQDEVARAIADEIRIKLLPTERVRLTTARTINPDAYDAYLRGLYHMNKRDNTDLEKSTAYFERAVGLDPDYALAYVGLADSYALRGSVMYMAMAPRDAMPKSKSAALRALQIDGNLGEAYATLAHVETFYDWDWGRSEEDFKRAIALKPNYALAHLWYAGLLTALGRHTESIAESNRGVELDPLSLVANTNLGLMLYFAGRNDDAIRQFHNLLELSPDFFVAHWGLGIAYEQKQMYGQAIVEFTKANNLSPGNSTMLESLGEAYALAGRRTEALQVLNQLTQLSRQEFVSPELLASLYVALRDKDHAFEFLEKAYDLRDNNLIFLKVDPALRTLQSDARFQGFLRRIGLSN